jgi:hypothetical protein
VEAALAALGETGIAQALRVSRWGYAAVSAGHVLGIALLVGAAVALDLRLLGRVRAIPAAAAVRLLGPVMGAGLALAAGSGLLLFSVRPLEYASVPALWAKLALILGALTNAAVFHRRAGRDPDRAGAGARIATAVVSAGCWIGALAAGRLIAFTMP